MISTLPPKLRTRVIIWLVALALIVAFCCYKQRENEKRSEKINRIALIRKNSLEEWNSSRDWLYGLRGKENSRQIIAEKLNQGKPFEYKVGDNYDYVQWTNPIYRFTLHMYFKDNVYMGYEAAAWDSEDVYRYYGLTDWFAMTPADYIRAFLLPMMFFAWFVFLLIGLYPSPFQQLAREGMVAAAIALRCLDYVDPGVGIYIDHDQPPEMSLSNWIIYLIGLVMLASSNCADQISFRFRLGSMLLFTAAVAMLIAARPVGLMLMQMIVVGVVIYFIWLFFCKRYLQDQEPEMLDTNSSEL